MAAHAHGRSGRRPVAAPRWPNQPDRHDARPGQGRAPGRRDRSRERRRHRHSGPERSRRRRDDVERRGGLRGRRQLRGHVGARRGPHGRRHGAPARLRALLHRHRAHGGRDAGPAGTARHRRLHLRARGGRRAAHGRLRAGREALGHGRHSRRLRLLTVARGLGALSDPDGAGADPHSRARERAGAPSRQRAGELHARRPISPGRGPRVPQLLRRGRLQFDRHRVGSRRGPRGGRVDRGRRAAHGSLGRRHPARGAIPGQRALPARPHGGDGGRPLRDALAVPATRDLSRRPHERAARSARVPRRLLRRRDGLGARQLVREAGDGTGLPLQLRSPELVSVLGGRAPRRA